MSPEQPNDPTTRLLTLLNVSALKRKRPVEQELEFTPAAKLNKRKSVQFNSVHAGPSGSQNVLETQDTTSEVELANDNDVEGELQYLTSAYEQHFGNTPKVLTEQSRASVEQSTLKTSKKKAGKLGNMLVQNTADASEDSRPSSISVLDRFKQPFITRQASQSRDTTEFQNDLLNELSTHRDLCMVGTPLEKLRPAREATALHIVDHISRKRRRVLKNNEKIAHQKKQDPNDPLVEGVQDQGFTRPSVLVLLPFRSSAMNWFNAITSHTPSPAFQIENSSRFQQEYGLPEGAVDKLASAAPGTYPRDHVETFKGNVDDSFRVGIKFTRKSVKAFSEFYASDVILASPLGLRMTIEKEKNADFLSSIEVLVVDQVDALTMQNWEHVQFVMSHLNGLPKESHDTDFSRLKQWYLDGHSAYLRQSIFLTAYETPEIRSLYNTKLKNVAGKARSDIRSGPVDVPQGIKQDFSPFHCAGPKDEADQRFKYFTTQVLPGLLKSAVQSANTVIFVPSSFDFIRVHNHFRKQDGVSFAVLSEYSSNQDISRARQSFFLGKASFLLVSERFHFFRRYKLRGIRNVVFYGPPDHRQFYTEFLSYPFLDDGVDASDVTAKVLFSKYDWFRMERIAGTVSARELVKAA
ncbi:digestive organ expansion factor [Pterulicium gracile]|uniref:U3 small nucleolar RNA-associated protein 25 n=1 Tax=Pterulicium gracile TaxID=1884261 RepID=A0A5C3QRP3_9AGAR|nr:digestive organ expansion factor [Pterula gracilis]